MNLELIDTYCIPTWAACYMESGEEDTLTEEEVADILDFLENLEEDYSSLTFDWSDDEPSFAYDLDIGALAGDYINCDIYGVKR